jgi:arylsulfatase A-like enzyme
MMEPQTRARAGAQGARSAAWRPQSLLSLPQALLVTVWFALAAGLAEVALRAVQKLALGGILRMSRQIVWMTPLGELFLLLPAALLLVLASVAWKGARSVRALCLLLGFIGGFSLLSLPWRINTYGLALLALGIAWRGSDYLASRPNEFLRWVRRSVGPMAGLVLAMAVALNGWLWLRERQALARLPAAHGGGPNVIFIIWDTVRAASVSLYGYARPTTPNLERLARRGVSFDRAIAAASWTLPSIGSIFTGRLPHELSGQWTTPLDAAYPTLAEAFTGNGYLTAGFAANVLYADWEHGLDRGFTHYEDYHTTPGQILASTSLGARICRGANGWVLGLPLRLLGWGQFVGRKHGETVTREFLDWLERRGDRPYFAFLNYFDAHLPYMPPAPFGNRFGPARPRTTVFQRVAREFRRKTFWDMPAAELAAEVAAYESGIAYMDDQLGLLLRELERRGQLENTIIIVASDHGEEFGEHGNYEHGGDVYLWQLHVPLVIVSPGRVPPGARVREPVSLRDLAATITDLTGLRTAGRLPGASLARAWTAPEEIGQSLVISEVAPGLDRTKWLRSAIVGRHHLVRNKDGREELYDFVSDPAERVDLTGSEAGERIEGWLRGLLDGALAPTSPRSMSHSPPGRGLP